MNVATRGKQFLGVFAEGKGLGGEKRNGNRRVCSRSEISTDVHSVQL